MFLGESIEKEFVITHPQVTSILARVAYGIAVVDRDKLPKAPYLSKMIKDAFLKIEFLDRNNQVLLRFVSFPGLKLYFIDYPEVVLIEFTPHKEFEQHAVKYLGEEAMPLIKVAQAYLSKAMKRIVLENTNFDTVAVYNGDNSFSIFHKGTLIGEVLILGDEPPFEIVLGHEKIGIIEKIDENRYVLRNSITKTFVGDFDLIKFYAIDKLVEHYVALKKI